MNARAPRNSRGASDQAQQLPPGRHPSMAQLYVPFFMLLILTTSGSTVLFHVEKDAEVDECPRRGAAGHWLFWVLPGLWAARGLMLAPTIVCVAGQRGGAGERCVGGDRLSEIFCTDGPTQRNGSRTNFTQAPVNQPVPDVPYRLNVWCVHTSSISGWWDRHWLPPLCLSLYRHQLN